jgi:flavin-binding protein dodecin
MISKVGISRLFAQGLAYLLLRAKQKRTKKVRLAAASARTHDPLTLGKALDPLLFNLTIRRYWRWVIIQIKAANKVKIQTRSRDSRVKTQARNPANRHKIQAKAESPATRNRLDDPLRRVVFYADREDKMKNHVYKILEIVGSSESNIEGAISTAIAHASKTVRNMDWFEVVQTRGHIVNGKIGHYQVTLTIGFTLES